MSAESWDHRSPTRILFGAGRFDELVRLVTGRVLLITTDGATRRGLTRRVTDVLAEAFVHDSVRPNPTLNAVGEAIARWRGHGVESLIALGGGSAIDVGKVLSLALVGDDITLDELLEPDHRWMSTKPLPLVAIPTTAGTGAEVTPFATVWDGEHHRKRSLSTPNLFPMAAIVDPDLTASLAWAETLSSGLDAFSQCFEAICNRGATPVTTALAERGTVLIPAALRSLRTGLGDSAARAAMSEAALLSGLAISQTRTGLAHSISYPITAHLGVPHGLACALALPGVLAYNIETDDGRLARVAAMSGLSDLDELVPSVLALYRDLGAADAIRAHVPDFGAVSEYRDEMFTPGRAENNSRPVDQAAIDRILGMTHDWIARSAS